MAFRIIVMPSAYVDLDEHAERIAEDSPENASKWLAVAWRKIFSLQEMPHRFAMIEESAELGVELRSVIHHSHRIIYRIDDDRMIVEIIRVYHGARKPLTQEDIV